MSERHVSSTEFRVTYTTIEEPVTVTVVGRPIGRWIPSGFLPAVVADAPPVPAERGVSTEHYDELPQNATTKVQTHDEFLAERKARQAKIDAALRKKT